MMWRAAACSGLILGFARCGTSAEGTDASTEAGTPEASLSDDAADAGGIQVSDWTTFDVSKVLKGASGFFGGTFDGRYVYLVP